MHPRYLAPVLPCQVPMLCSAGVLQHSLSLSGSAHYRASYNCCCPEHFVVKYLSINVHHRYELCNDE
eukprot:3563720-Pyramimonas_sp.AAC.2